MENRNRLVTALRTQSAKPLLVMPQLPSASRKVRGVHTWAYRDGRLLAFRASSLFAWRCGRGLFLAFSLPSSFSVVP